MTKSKYNPFWEPQFQNILTEIKSKLKSDGIVKFSLPEIKSFSDRASWQGNLNIIKSRRENRSGNSPLRALADLLIASDFFNGNLAQAHLRLSLNENFDLTITLLENNSSMEHENFGIIASIGWNSSKWTLPPTDEDLKTAITYGWVKENGEMGESINFGHLIYPTESDGKYIGYTPHFNRLPAKANNNKVIFLKSRSPENTIIIVGCYAFPEIGQFNRKAKHKIYNDYNYGNIKSYPENISFFEFPINARNTEFLPEGKSMGKMGFNYIDFDNVEQVFKEAIRYNPSDERLKAIAKNVLGFPVEVQDRNYYLIGSKYGPNNDEDIFPDLIKESVVATGFAWDIDLNNLYGKPSEEIISFLRKKGEDSKSYSALKHFLNLKPGDWVAVKGSGSPRGDTAYLSVIGIAEVINKDGKIYEYDPDNLGHIIHVKFLHAPIMKELELGYGRTIHKLTNQDHIDLIFNNNPLPTPSKPEQMKNEIFINPNLILYGPPGTGKTYQSITHAVAIIDDWNNEQLQEKLNIKQTRAERKIIKDRFDELKKDGQIEFITFHQNYSYEDFVQGLKPDTDSNNELSFRPHFGIFHQICRNAEDNYRKSKTQTGFIEPSFEEVFSSFTRTLEEEDQPIEVAMKREGYSFHITSINNGRSINFTKHSGGTAHTLNIQTLKNIYEGTKDFVSGLISYYTALIDALKNHAESLRNAIIHEPLKKYVLIIDEINRANISRVFGELITLIEKDKRLGEENHIQVKLPSGELFSVPPNLYIPGTMNTADKSIALVDIALRRRFEFIPMYPQSHLIDDPSLKTIFRLLNKAIYEQKKKSADFLLGHAYFMGQTRNDLKELLEKRVIPLLNEYFMNNTDKVKSILTSAHLKCELDLDTYQLKYIGVDESTIARVATELAKIEALNEA